jgi:hypothetical protein
LDQSWKTKKFVDNVETALIRLCKETEEPMEDERTYDLLKYFVYFTLDIVRGEADSESKVVFTVLDALSKRKLGHDDWIPGFCAAIASVINSRDAADQDSQQWEERFRGLVDELDLYS